MSFSSAVRWEVGKMLSEVISLSDIAGTFLICPFSCGFQWVKKISAPPICLWARHISDIHTQLSSVFLHSQPFFFFPSSVSCPFSCHSLYSSSLCSFLILSSWVQGNSVHTGCFEPTYEWGCPRKEVAFWSVGCADTIPVNCFFVLFCFKDCWRSHLCLNICDLCAVFNWSSSYNTVKSFC